MFFLAQYASSAHKLVEVTIDEGLLPFMHRLSRPGLPSSSGGCAVCIALVALLINSCGDTGDGDTKSPPQVVGVEGFI